MSQFFYFIGIMINGDEIEEKYMFSIGICNDVIKWLSTKVSIYE